MKFMNLFTLIPLFIATLFLPYHISTCHGNETGEEQFLKNTRQLIYEGKRSGEGYFSEDGKALIFQSEREPDNPFFQIYLLDLETGDTNRISPGTGKTTCSFIRPGSNEVLFASTHLDPEARAKQQAEFDIRASGKNKRFTWDYDEHYDIFSAHRDGSNLKRLTNALGYDAEGAYSPDGSKIVFCSLRDAYPVENLSPEDKKHLETDPSYFGEIYIMNADGSEQKRLTDQPGYDGGPFFSPDGKRIIWRHFKENGLLADVYTMNLDGSDKRRLTDFGSMSWAPYYHPSNKYVIFHSNKFGFTNCELFIVDVQGEKEPIRVTFTDGFDGLPVFSPDGKKVVWTSNRTSQKTSQLFIADWNHEQALSALNAAPARKQAEKTPAFDMQESRGKITSQESVQIPSFTEKIDHSFSPEIKEEDLHAIVAYLASDELEGRLTGTMGSKMASEYIAHCLEKNGLLPFGNSGSYFQEFPFTSGVEIVKKANSFSITNNSKITLLEPEEDFRPLAFTANGVVEGGLVFAGYGISMPGGNGAGYDSYAGIDVKDKVVLVLNYIPEKVEMKRRQNLNRYSSLRYKAMVAREHGAKALLVVTGPNSPNAGELLTLSYDKASADSGIIAASISGEVVKTLFSSVGKDLATVQSELDIEKTDTQTVFDFPGIKVNISTAVQREKSVDRNVIAYLPPATGNKDDCEYIVVGAHLDHIGHGGAESLGRKGEEGMIHNGADDNASGVSVVLELAADMADMYKNKPQDKQRGIVFTLWSGEEMGLLGSSHFIKNPTFPLKNIIAYVNFDMVGRLKDNKLIIQGTDSSKSWPRLFEKRNIMAGFNLLLQHDPYLPTDATSFYPEGIPIMNFFTGSHEDYNRPTDDTETLNYEGMVRIARFAKNIISDVIKNPERPDYFKVKHTGPPESLHGSRRSYLGTIPDFTTEDIEGLKLSGIKAGGPADKAGLQAGDIIVKFGDLEITNIYDYKYALDVLKIGEPVIVEYIRDGKNGTLTVVPEAKK
ncbi:MAG: M28 family peptidase [Candidatus Kuenenia sp.]|nr:M28 family peptidase [Candidatus Kuenenia hertensis]